MSLTPLTCRRNAAVPERTANHIISSPFTNNVFLPSMGLLPPSSDEKEEGEEKATFLSASSIAVRTHEAGGNFPEEEKAA